VLITYIVKSTKKKKDKPRKKDLPLLKSDITTIVRSQKSVIYRYYAGCTNKKDRAIADPALITLKASFVSRHRPVR